MPQILIIGASRGIGAGLVREFAGRGWTVTGTVRREQDKDAVTQAGGTPALLEMTDRAAAARLHVDPARTYESFEEMARAEADRHDGIDVVSIVTPNHLHVPAARAFLNAGVDVICDKPMSVATQDAVGVADLVASSLDLSVAQRQDLLRLAKADLAKADTDRDAWERRVAGLRNNHLNPDTLDERARAMLNLADPTDIMVLYPPKEKLF